MKVMVTGGRSRTDRAVIREALEGVQSGPMTLIHGDAPGVDSIAAEEAHQLGWEVVAFKADWAEYGRRAGPIRNREMVESKPNVVLAFPGPHSIGTWDAIRKAKKAGIEVRIFGA